MITPKIKNKNNKMKVSLKAFFSMVAALLFSFLILFIGIRASIKATESKKKSIDRVELLKAELKELQTKKLLLEKKIEEIKSNRYLEKSLRQSLNLKKEGEKVVIFPVVDNGKNNTVRDDVDREKIIKEVLSNRLAK